MLSLNSYLVFQGNCREAMEFYNSILQGKLEISTFADMPPGEMEVPDTHKGQILHASITVDSFFLMASDTMPGSQVTVGDNVALSIEAGKDVERGEQIFKALFAGGQVDMPFDNTFWGAKFGMGIDKFGVKWMVNCQLDGK